MDILCEQPLIQGQYFYLFNKWFLLSTLMGRMQYMLERFIQRFIKNIRRSSKYVKHVKEYEKCYKFEAFEHKFEASLRYIKVWKEILDREKGMPIPIFMVKYADHIYKTLCFNCWSGSATFLQLSKLRHCFDLTRYCSVLFNI